MGWTYYVGRVNLKDIHQGKGSKEVVIRVDDVEYPDMDAQLPVVTAALQEWAEQFDDIIDPLIVGATLTVPIKLLSLKGTAGPNGVSVGANLKLATLHEDAHEFERPYFLPGATAGVFLANNRDIDTTDTALLEWIAAFNQDTSQVQVTISDEEQVLSIVDGRYGTKAKNSN